MLVNVGKFEAQSVLAFSHLFIDTWELQDPGLETVWNILLVRLYRPDLSNECSVATPSGFVSGDRGGGEVQCGSFFWVVTRI